MGKIATSILSILAVLGCNMATASPVFTDIADEMPIQSLTGSITRQGKLPVSVLQYAGSSTSASELTESQRDWVNDQLRDLDYDPDGRGEIAVGLLNLDEVGTVSDINDEAIRVTRDLYPDARGHNDEADAFRHTYFNARLTQELGEESAKEWGDAHERSNPNPVDELIMDLNNNRAGRDIGSKNMDLEPSELADKIRDEISNGGGSVITEPPTVGGDSSGSSDPHFMGFDHSKFSFNGESNRHYILFGSVGGDILVSKMRLAKKDDEVGTHPKTYFDSFGLTIGQGGNHVTVSLVEDARSMWKIHLRVDGKEVTDMVHLESAHISVSAEDQAVVVSTSESLFTFRAKSPVAWKRHLDVTVTVKEKRVLEVGYLGILGVTLNKSLGLPVQKEFENGMGGMKREEYLRKYFEVDSMFPTYP